MDGYFYYSFILKTADEMTINMDLAQLETTPENILDLSQKIVELSFLQILEDFHSKGETGNLQHERWRKVRQIQRLLRRS